MKFTRSAAAGLGILSLAIWFGPADAQLLENGDTPVYLNYARAMFDGRLPWRDFGIEYPPFALPLFLIPYFFGQADYTYLIAFTVLMAAINTSLVVVTVLSVAKAGRSNAEQLAAGLLVAVAPLLIGSGIVQSRYDLWPTLLVSCAVLAMLKGRMLWSAGFMAAGAAAKIWPGLMIIPLLALAYRTGGRRRLAGAVSVIGLVLGVPFLAALAIGGQGFINLFGYHLERPLQIESFGAVLLVFLWRFAGIDGPYTDDVDFGSFNLMGPGVEAIGTVTGMFSMVLIISANYLGARKVLRARDDSAAVIEAVHYGFAAVLALMAFGKVLSPQFLIWILPMPFLLGSRRWPVAAVLAVMMALTGWIFFDYFRFVKDMDPLWTAILFFRNVLLAGLALAMIFGLEARRKTVVADQPVPA